MLQLRVITSMLFWIQNIILPTSLGNYQVPTEYNKISTLATSPCIIKLLYMDIHYAMMVTYRHLSTANNYFIIGTLKIHPHKRVKS